MNQMFSSSRTLLWCCLLFNFTQFVILENLLRMDLALSGVKGLAEVEDSDKVAVFLVSCL